MGGVPDITGLANAVDAGRKHTARNLGRTSLAPLATAKRSEVGDLVQAILAGNEPSGLSLTKECKGVPEVWEERRDRWTKEHQSWSTMECCRSSVVKAPDRPAGMHGAALPPSSQPALSV